LSGRGILVTVLGETDKAEAISSVLTVRWGDFISNSRMALK